MEKGKVCEEKGRKKAMSAGRRNVLGKKKKKKRKGRTKDLGEIKKWNIMEEEEYLGSVVGRNTMEYRETSKSNRSNGPLRSVCLC